MDLSAIRNTVLDGTTKGIPGTAAPFSLDEIGTKAWNVLAEDLPLPLMVLKRSSLDHNAKVFEEYLTANGLSFAPHGKTTMTPQIFAEQLAHGAWAMTAATVNQVEVMRRFGVARIILANQLLGRSAVRTIAAEINADPAFEFYCFVDSIEQLGNIERHLAGVALNGPIRLLVEIGIKGGRTGVRGAEAGLALIEAIRAADSSKFRFSGLAAFEGVVPGIAKDTSPIDAFAETIASFARGIPGEAYASPAYASFKDFPPVMVHAGAHEVLRDDASKLGDRAAEAGVSVSVEIYDGMGHLFQADPSRSEARASLTRLGQFVRARTQALAA